jgi:hypothetical protein
VFDVGDGRKLTGGAEFADCTAGRFDGMRFDTTAACGPRPTTACTASTPTAR